MKNGIQELGDMANDNCTHWWIIDSSNVGRCRYCPAERDFGELLLKQGVFVAAGRRGAKARKEVLGQKRGRKKKEPANAKISAAAKKRWQDPEYQAKQSAALSGRHHKKEEFYE